MAPITIERPFSSMPVSPSICAEVDEVASASASRSFMVGISVWPPARSFASAFLAEQVGRLPQTVSGGDI